MLFLMIRRVKMKFCKLLKYISTFQESVLIVNLKNKLSALYLQSVQCQSTVIMWDRIDYIRP